MTKVMLNVKVIIVIIEYVVLGNVLPKPGVKGYPCLQDKYVMRVFVNIYNFQMVKNVSMERNASGNCMYNVR